MKRIIVNTVSTKKSSGGACWIAYNFLIGTLRFSRNDVEWFYITSSDMDELVGHRFADIKDKKYFVFPTQPDFKGSYMRVRRELRLLEQRLKADVVYSISSPCYFSFKTTEVMRFANAWVTNPNKYAVQLLAPYQRIRLWLYCKNQRRLLRKAKYMITQTHTVKNGLLRITHLPDNQICVVPNVLPSVFSEHAPKTCSTLDSQWIDVACIASAVPHKNIDIVTDILHELKDRYQVTNLRFHITVPWHHKLWSAIQTELKNAGLEGLVVNHGICSQQDLIPLYEQCSISFIPTLLETFSAAPLEAMYFGLNIVASDFDFNREIVGDAGLYHKPKDAKDAADKIYELITSPQLCKSLTYNGYKNIKRYSDYSVHFNNIVSFLLTV